MSAFRGLGSSNAQLAEVVAAVQLTDLAAVAANDRVAVEHHVERVARIRPAPTDALPGRELDDLDVLGQRLAVTGRARPNSRTSAR